MKSLIKNIFSPIFSLFLFAIGNGLLNTLLVLKLYAEGSTSVAIGLMSALFYLGLFIGSFNIEKLIIRVGHIRAFSAFASILTVSTLIQAVYYDLYLWLLLRLIAGICSAGIYVVIEGWLLTIGNYSMRGRVLSIYMVVLYSAQALGQMLIKFNDIQPNLLFILVAATSALSVIPLSLTKSKSPVLEAPSALGIREIFDLTKTGAIGCMCSGLILSCIYGLIPFYIIKEMNDNDLVALGMFLVILGGMLFQYPIGKLSDLIERRKVLFLLCLSSMATCLLIIYASNTLILFYLAIFILGGVTFTLYPISISHACDSLDNKDITSGTQALLLFYSIGAVSGPLIAPIFIRLLGSSGLFIFFISISLFLLYVVSWRKVVTNVLLPEEPFINVTSTSPVILELDPRGNEQKVK